MILGEKVKRRPIMPDVVSLLRLPDRGIRDDPTNLGAAPKAASSGLKCSLGEIENGDVLEASLDEIINQT